MLFIQKHVAAIGGVVPNGPSALRKRDLGVIYSFSLFLPHPKAVKAYLAVAVAVDSVNQGLLKAADVFIDARKLVCSVLRSHHQPWD
jgi:hypothetical protein